MMNTVTAERARVDLTPKRPLPVPHLFSDAGQVAHDDHPKIASIAPINESPASRRLSPMLRVPGSHLSSEGGQGHTADHLRDADLAPISGEGGLCRTDTHAICADLSALCSRLRELHRQRQDLHRAEKSLTLQIKAKCRRLSDGDKKAADVLYKAMFGKGDHDMAAIALAVSAPFIAARSMIEENRSSVEKQMEREAKKLPVIDWLASVRGFGLGSLAAVIGETGDLSQYANPAKVWKRMGMAVIGGGRQRRVTGADAIDHGYSPTRRSIMWNIGDCIVKAQIRKVKDDDGEATDERTSLGELGAIYLQRKAYERPRVETDMHAHNRAKRYIEKRLLRDLWRAWRDSLTIADQ